jgi:chromosome partitioning protein
MLGAAEIMFAEIQDRQSMLSAILEPVHEQYDYVLIDCLPSLGLMAINALQAATGVVIPVQAHFLAVQGLVQMLETVRAVRDQLNPSLEIYGILLTMVDSRAAHNQRVINTVRRSLEGQVPVFQTEIAYNTALTDSTELGKTVFDLPSGRRTANTFRSLAREVAVAAGDSSVSIESPRASMMDGLLRRFGRQRPTAGVTVAQATPKVQAA